MLGKKEREGWYSDSPENIYKCLHCTKPTCTNCLASENEETEPANPCGWEDLVERFGVSSVFGKSAIYDLWKKGYGDREIGRRLHSSHQNIYSIRREMGLKSFVSGHDKKEKAKTVREFLKDNPEIKEKWDAICGALEDGFDSELFELVYPTGNAYADIDVGFGDSHPWDNPPVPAETVVMMRAAIYKLWKHGYSDQETATVLGINRSRCQQSRRTIGLGMPQGASSREVRITFAANFLKEFPNIKKEWEPIVKFFEDANGIQA